MAQLPYYPREVGPAEFLDLIWKGQSGHACITVKVSDGVRTMEDHWFSWPTDRDSIEEFALAQAEDHDVYFVPALQDRPVRRKGHCTELGNIWVDLDGSEPTAKWIERYRPLVIESGTPGNLHLHLPLAGPVEVGRGTEANRALADQLGGDRAPTHEAALMRLPGTLNHKHEPAQPVYLISDPALVSRLAGEDLPSQSRDVEPAAEKRRFTKSQAADYIERYALQPLREAEEPGRNIQLNKSAVVLGHFVDEFGDRDTAVEMLMEAAIECGIDSDDDTPGTIKSGLDRGMKEPYTLVRTDLDEEVDKLRTRDLAARAYELEKFPFASALASKSFQSGSDLVQKYRKFKTTPPRFLVRGVIKERSYGALGAEYKAGKTWMCLDLAVSVALGRPWLGKFEVEGRHRVAYMLGEGQEEEFFRRLEAIAGDRTEELLTSWISVQIGSSNLSDPAQLERIHRELTEFKPALTIVDPWYLSAGEVDGKNIVVAGRVLDNISGMARMVGSALLIAQHWNKTGQGNGTSRWAGSGLQEWARFMINVEVTKYQEADPEDETGQTAADIRMGFSGEVSGHYDVRRVVWTDNYLDASSEMHYAVTCDTGAKKVEKGSFEDRLIQAIEAAGHPLIKAEICAALNLATSGAASQKVTAQLERLHLGSDPRITAGPAVGRSKTWTIEGID